MEICRVFSKKNYFSIQINSAVTRNSGRILGKKWGETSSRHKSQKIVVGGREKKLNKINSNKNTGKQEINVNHEQYGG